MGITATLAVSPARADAIIAVAGPATGRHAEALAALVAGARRGAGDAGFRLMDVDDGCDAARGEGAARMIALAKPDFVVGHPCPAAAIAAAKIYAAAGIVFIAVGVRHPDLTNRRAGPTIFRFAGRDDRQGAEAAAALGKLAPDGRIAIVQDRTAYARGLTAAIAAELTSRKLPPPVIVPIVAGRRDYDVELAKLAAAPPQAIFFAGYPSEAGVVLRGLRKARVAGPLIASDANATDEFAAVARGLDQSGTNVMVMTRAPGSGGLEASSLAEAAQRAVEAWRQVLEKARPVKAPLPASSAVAPDGSGAGGDAFDEKGDARIPSFVTVPLDGGRPKSASAGPDEPAPAKN